MNIEEYSRGHHDRRGEGTCSLSCYFQTGMFQLVPESLLAPGWNLETTSAHSVSRPRLIVYVPLETPNSNNSKLLAPKWCSKKITSMLIEIGIKIAFTFLNFRTPVMRRMVDGHTGAVRSYRDTQRRLPNSPSQSHFTRMVFSNGTVHPAQFLVPFEDRTAYFWSVQPCSNQTVRGPDLILKFLNHMNGTEQCRIFKKRACEMALSLSAGWSVLTPLPLSFLHHLQTAPLNLVVGNYQCRSSEIVTPGDLARVVLCW